MKAALFALLDSLAGALSATFSVLLLISMYHVGIPSAGTDFPSRFAVTMLVAMPIAGIYTGLRLVILTEKRTRPGERL